jgi:hypothetical protein
VMITVEVQVHGEKLFEEIVEFLWSEIVMRQLSFTTIERNIGSWLNLLEWCSLGTLTKSRPLGLRTRVIASTKAPI